MVSYKKISCTIDDTFESNLFTLGSGYQSHWALRKWRITGDAKYILPLYYNFQFLTLSNIPRILNKNLSDREIGKRMLQGYRANSRKKKMRLMLYNKNPEIVYYMALIFYLFMAKTFNMDSLPKFKFYFQSGLEKLRKKKWKKILIDSDLVMVNPSSTANTVYSLKYIGICDLEEHLHELFKKVWLVDEPKDEIGWQNKIYALTHVVIAGSYFYQTFINASKFRWIFDYFEKDIEKIIKYANADIVAEVGVVFKLARLGKNRVVNKAKRFVASKFDSQLGYIPNGEKNTSLEKSEHRNILALLLLLRYQKLNKGPNLAQFIKENRKAIFVPEKGKYIGFDELKD